MNQAYQDYLNSEGWKAKRAMILNMWENRCALCNEGGELHLHHRTYERKGNEDPYDLIPLCKKHHGIFHDKEKHPGYLEPEMTIEFWIGMLSALRKTYHYFFKIDYEFSPQSSLEDWLKNSIESMTEQVEYMGMPSESKEIKISLPLDKETESLLNGIKW